MYTMIKTIPGTHEALKKFAKLQEVKLVLSPGLPLSYTSRKTCKSKQRVQVPHQYRGTHLVKGRQGHERGHSKERERESSREGGPDEKAVCSQVPWSPQDMRWGEIIKKCTAGLKSQWERDSNQQSDTPHPHR